MLHFRFSVLFYVTFIRHSFQDSNGKFCLTTRLLNASYLFATIYQFHMQIRAFNCVLLAHQLLNRAILVTEVFIGIDSNRFHFGCKKNLYAENCLDSLAWTRLLTIFLKNQPQNIYLCVKSHINH